MPLTENPPDAVRRTLEGLAASESQNGNGSKPRGSVQEDKPVAVANGARNGNGKDAGEPRGRRLRSKKEADTEPSAEDQPVDTGLPNTRISLASDITKSGTFGERWLIVDDKRVLVVSVENGHATVDHDIALDDIADTDTEQMVGIAALILRLKNGVSMEAIRYSAGLGAHFGAAARTLQAYVKGEEPSESIALGLEKRVCPKCGDPLPADSNVCGKCVDKRATLLRLLRYALPFRNRLILVTALMILSTAFTLAPPVFQQKLTDDVLIAHRHREWIGWIVGGLIGTAIMGLVLGIWRGRVASYVSNHLVYSLRTQAYGRLQELSIGYYDKRQTGALVSRVTQDVNELQSFLIDGLQLFVVNILTIIGMLIILLKYNWQLTLLILIPVPITIWMVRRTFKMLWRRLHRMFSQRSSLNASITSVLAGVRVVKAFAQEHRERERFEDKAQSLRDSGIVVEQSWQTYFPILGFITGFGTYIIWWIGGLESFANFSNDPSKGMTIGVLTMFLAYSQRLLGPLQDMTRIADWLSRSMTSAERVFEVIDAQPDVANAAEPVNMPRIEGRVELKNVRFSYDKNSSVLEDISIDVKPGEMIGLVGHSGAGKSTIINLMSRFYDVKEGQILIDGVDIRDIDMNDLRRQIGIVLQEPFLFPGTISENIAYSRPGATPEEIMQAAKAANAHEFVMRFPDGYDTYVGERGARLSGGERQRLSIARAILHDPRILILDEATASVDTQTEKQIQEAITRLIKGRTTFAIAHRLSTLRNADRLMVIERGKLVELGTHDELLSKPEGVFRKLVDMQQAVNQLRSDIIDE